MTRVCLVIIDGFGISKNEIGNATRECRFIESLKKTEKYLELQASGKYVGILDYMPGNSEVGHFTIGSGRIVEQSLMMINELERKGELKKLVLEKDLSKRVHLVGLLSDGGVHSHTSHVKFLEKILVPEHQVFIHAISDGIDSSSKSFINFFKKFDNIVSVAGRYYTMDRDSNWDRIEQSFKMMVKGKVEKLDVSNLETESCEFIKPTLIKDEKIQKEDTVILFNFRADRMRQIYSKFKNYCKTYTLDEYELNDPNSIIKKDRLINGLSEWLSKHNKKQVHIAETEKFAHVTYFFNGGKEIKHENETWIIVDSPKTDRFSKTPGTSMNEVANRAIQEMQKAVDFVVLNFAAPDLVGHSGVFESVCEACRILDKEIERLFEVSKKNDYILMIVSDHGNAEEMYRDGEIYKTHTTNPVPFIIANTELKIIEKDVYSLQDVAPTILKIMKIEKPAEMKGSSVLED